MTGKGWPNADEAAGQAGRAVTGKGWPNADEAAGQAGAP